MSLKDSSGTKRLPLRDAYRFGVGHGFATEIAKIREMKIDWNRSSSLDSRLRRGYVIELFEEKGVFEIFKDRHWANGNEDDGRRRIQNDLNLKADHELYQQSGGDTYSLGDIEESEEIDEETTSTFAYEANLRDYLARNLHLIEPELTLYKETNRDGVEYPIEGGRIDILAQEQTGRLVVIELKLSRGRNSTIGQLSYYMGWVNKYMPKSEKSRGIIIANEVSADLILACAEMANICLYEYTLAVTLNKVDPN